MKFDPAPALPPARVSRDLVQQILLNFIFNAAEAMTKHPQILLSTYATQSLSADLALAPASAASYVCAVVRDFGCGIPSENLPRIFEPFFTTKALSARRGTGLGLSMVYELARKMEAGLAVDIRSRPRQHFCPHPARARSASGARLPPPMNAPTLLIVEDDDLQYEIYEEALAHYRLVRVQNGSQALTSIPQTRPDLLILDHVLSEGEMGLDFLPEFKELLPYVPIIVVSGALEVHQQMDALQGPRRAHYCLTKPVDIHALQQVVAIALKECGETEIVRQFEALERSHRIDVHELLSRSTDRLSRQNHIRDRVAQSLERPNISALAREFGVARRTIIRDLQELIRRGQLKPEVYPEWEDPLPEE